MGIEIVETPHKVYARGTTLWSKFKLMIRHRKVDKRYAIDPGDELNPPKFWTVFNKEDFKWV